MINLKGILAVAKYTAIDLVRSKILLNLVITGPLLLICTWLSFELSYGVQLRVALDIGLGLNFLSMVFIAIFLGANIISKDIKDRTIQLVLSGPLKRRDFLLGKIVGMIALLMINFLVLSSLVLFLYKIMGGVLVPLIYWCLFFDFMAGIILFSLVCFFSLISNVVISIMMTLGLLVLGNVLEELSHSSFLDQDGLLMLFIKGVKWITPNLSVINLKDLVLYQSQPTNNFILVGVGYTCFYILFLTILSIIFFDKKELR